MAEQKEILESIRDVLGGRDDDILDLTQKVNDDGSITEITPKHKEVAPQRIEPVINIPKAEIPAPKEPEPTPKIAQTEPDSDDILSEIDSILGSKPIDEKVELEFMPKPEIIQQRFEIAEEFEATPEPEPMQAAVKIIETHPHMDANIMPRTPEQIAEIEGKQMDNQQVSADDAKNSISELMGKLKQDGREAKTASAPTPFRSGTTLEDLVVEMLKPMMKDWLDNNLPKLVKETVQKEIQKLIPKE